MELSGGGGDGESAAKRARLSSSDADSSAAAAAEDRLSSLPIDVLVSILLHLSTRTAARTSVLSRHWRRIWALLPKLRFPKVPEPHRLRDAIDAHGAPLLYLYVAAQGATAESLGVWLPAAARRVSGVLTLLNYNLRYGARKEEEAAQGGALELPCFEKATAIYLLLDFLGLAVPPAGVSTRLTRIYLRRVWFHGPGDLGDTVSSPRCPCLQLLDVDGARGLGGRLSIHSESMLHLELKNLCALSKLTVVAPALKELTVAFCFPKTGPVANISAPLLTKLLWNDVYDPGSVNLGKMEHLGCLGTYSCFVYEYRHFMRNQSSLSFLQRFEGFETLLLTLVYPLDTEYYYYQYMRREEEDMTVLSSITWFSLMVDGSGHAFGGSALFHVLRLCTGIRKLMLQFVTSDSEAQTVCSWDCMCNQPADWQTKALLLNHLEEVEIDGLRGSKHEFAFVKRVFNWVTKLKEMAVTFHSTTSEIKAKKLYQVFQILSRPEVCMKFYIYRNCSKVLYAPED